MIAPGLSLYSIREPLWPEIPPGQLEAEAFNMDVDHDPQDPDAAAELEAALAPPSAPGPALPESRHEVQKRLGQLAEIAKAKAAKGKGRGKAKGTSGSSEAADSAPAAPATSEDLQAFEARLLGAMAAMEARLIAAIAPKEAPPGGADGSGSAGDPSLWATCPACGKIIDEDREDPIVCDEDPALPDKEPMCGYFHRHCAGLTRTDLTVEEEEAFAFVCPAHTKAKAS